MITHVIRMKYVELPIIPTEYNGYLEVLAGDMSDSVLEEIPVKPTDFTANGYDYATLNFTPSNGETVLLTPGDLILVHKESNDFSVVLSSTEHLTEMLCKLVRGEL